MASRVLDGCRWSWLALAVHLAAAAWLAPAVGAELASELERAVDAVGAFGIDTGQPIVLLYIDVSGSMATVHWRCSSFPCEDGETAGVEIAKQLQDELEKLARSMTAVPARPRPGGAEFNESIQVADPSDRDLMPDALDAGRLRLFVFGKKVREMAELAEPCDLEKESWTCYEYSGESPMEQRSVLRGPVEHAALLAREQYPGRTVVAVLVSDFIDDTRKGDLRIELPEDFRNGPGYGGGRNLRLIALLSPSRNEPASQRAKEGESQANLDHVIESRTSYFTLFAKKLEHNVRIAALPGIAPWMLDRVIPDSARSTLASIWHEMGRFFRTSHLVSARARLNGWEVTLPAQALPDSIELSCKSLPRAVPLQFKSMSSQRETPDSVEPRGAAPQLSAGPQDAGEPQGAERTQSTAKFCAEAPSCEILHRCGRVLSLEVRERGELQATIALDEAPVRLCRGGHVKIKEPGFWRTGFQTVFAIEVVQPAAPGSQPRDGSARFVPPDFTAELEQPGPDQQCPSLKLRTISDERRPKERRVSRRTGAGSGENLRARTERVHCTQEQELKPWSAVRALHAQRLEICPEHDDKAPHDHCQEPEVVSVTDFRTIVLHVMVLVTALYLLLRLVWGRRHFLALLGVLVGAVSLVSGRPLGLTHYVHEHWLIQYGLLGFFLYCVVLLGFEMWEAVIVSGARIERGRVSAIAESMRLLGRWVGCFACVCVLIYFGKIVWFTELKSDALDLVSTQVVFDCQVKS